MQQSIYEDNVPLVKGQKAKTREGFSENVRREIHAGKPQKQAVAIAYSVARNSKSKKSATTKKITSKKTATKSAVGKNRKSTGTKKATSKKTSRK